MNAVAQTHPTKAEQIEKLQRWQRILKHDYTNNGWGNRAKLDFEVDDLQRNIDALRAEIDVEAAA